MTFVLEQTFKSPTNPSHEVQYVHLNRGAAHTLVMCYGAGYHSVFVNLYRSFLETHSSLSILCVDRWTLASNPSDSSAVSRTGPGLLSELTSITVELLNSLDIQKFSIAAHSGGAYQMMDLARNSAPSGRVENIFPICTHIPAQYTSSKISAWMCTMPESLFTVATKFDASFANSILGRTLVRRAYNSNPEMFVDSLELRDQLVNTYQPSPKQVIDRAERHQIDYYMIFNRIPGIDLEALKNVWTDLELSPDVRIAWFTTEGDALFNPAGVRRIVPDMKSAKNVDIIVVEGGNHGDMLFRTEVWEEMWRRMVKSWGVLGVSRRNQDQKEGS